MNDRFEKVTKLLNFLGGVSGVIALLTIVFYGGAMAEQVKSLQVRVTNLESQGSSQVREHIREDAAQFHATDQRVLRLESLMNSIPADLSRITTKLEIIEKKMDKL